MGITNWASMHKGRLPRYNKSFKSMPNTQILPPVEGESNEAPRKFKNIDIEPFEFTWDNVPFGGVLPERMKSWQEKIIETDAEGKPRKNEQGEIISRTVTKYEILRPIQSGEIVIMPKYLVNYAAMHLAKKMVKRQAIEDYIPEKPERKEIELANARITVRNPEKEMELQKKMVAANFEEQPKKEEVKEEKKEETPSGGVEQFKCDVCGFIAKSAFGLRSHQRKHK